MSIAGEFEIREAVDVDDDDAVAALMVEYLTWAHVRLHDEYAIEEPPADVALVRNKLGEYRRPRGLLLLAECNGEPAGVGALRWLAEGVAGFSGCTCQHGGEVLTLAQRCSTAARRGD